MGLLPDWNSIESTTRWSEGLFWVGIVALALVAVTELAAHLYGNRATYLVSVHDRIEAEARQGQERQTERRYAAETGSLQKKLDSANAETASLQEKLNSANAVLQNFKSSSARHLLDPQTNELLKSLAPFAGQKITVWCSDGASDGVPLGREFIAVLRMAGWVVPNAVLTGPVVGGDTDGIRVVFEGDLPDPSQVPRGIDTLIATLGRVGLISNQTLYLDPRARGGEYLLKIGRKPSPTRTKS